MRSLIPIVFISAALLLSACVTTPGAGGPAVTTPDTGGQPVATAPESGSKLVVNLAPEAPVAGNQYLVPGGTAEYSVNISGAHSRMSVDRTSPQTQSRSDGRVTQTTSWGNPTSVTTADGRTATYTPHSGFLPEEPMRIDLTWETSYRAKEFDGKLVGWTRSCRVSQRDTISVPAGTYPDVWRVECTARQDDGEVRVEDTTWWSSQGRISLHNERKQVSYGRKTSNSFELTAVSAAMPSQIGALPAKP